MPGKKSGKVKESKTSNPDNSKSHCDSQAQSAPSTLPLRSEYLDKLYECRLWAAGIRLTLQRHLNDNTIKELDFNSKLIIVIRLWQSIKNKLAQINQDESKVNNLDTNKSFAIQGYVAPRDIWFKSHPKDCNLESSASDPNIVFTSLPNEPTLPYSQHFEYAAPESICFNIFSEASNVYNLGVLTYLILTGSIYNFNLDASSLYQSNLCNAINSDLLKSNNLQPLPKAWNTNQQAAFVNFCMLCASNNPSLRPNLDQALNYFNKIQQEKCPIKSLNEHLREFISDMFAIHEITKEVSVLNAQKLESHRETQSKFLNLFPDGTTENTNNTYTDITRDFSKLAEKLLEALDYIQPIKVKLLEEITNLSDIIHKQNKIDIESREESKHCWESWNSYLEKLLQNEKKGLNINCGATKLETLLRIYLTTDTKSKIMNQYEDSKVPSTHIFTNSIMVLKHVIMAYKNIVVAYNENTVSNSTVNHEQGKENYTDDSSSESILYPHIDESLSISNSRFFVQSTTQLIPAAASLPLVSNKTAATAETKNGTTTSHIP